MKIHEKAIHLLWEQGVAGSNPATPTLKIKALQKCKAFLL